MFDFLLNAQIMLALARQDPEPVIDALRDTPALPDPALEFTLDGDSELRAVEAQLAAAEAVPEGQHDGHLIGELHGRYGEIGGYAARARAAELLHGLGFSDADHARPVADFSGGTRSSDGGVAPAPPGRSGARALLHAGDLFPRRPRDFD